MTALAGVELESLVSEPDALTTRPPPYRWKTNGFFIIRNIRKRIYIKRFSDFAFVVVSFNLQNFVVFFQSIEWPSSTACLERAVALLSPFFTSLICSFLRVSNQRLALVAVTAIYFVNGSLLLENKLQ